LADLRRHYRRKNRPEAIRNLELAMREAARQITAGKGLPAPRPYPELAQAGRAWTHAGRYWVRYTTSSPHVIVAVFHDQADITGRL
jgi:plasmid stabilization system protein ParE